MKMVAKDRIRVIQSILKRKVTILVDFVLDIVPGIARLMKSCVKAKKIVTVVIQKKFVVQKPKIRMGSFVRTIPLLMVAQLSVMRLREKFYAQHTRMLSVVSQRKFVFHGQKTLKVE